MVLDSACMMFLKFPFFFFSFSYLVAAAGLQSIWSIALAITDAYALLVGRRLQNPQIVRLFAVGDGVSSSPSLMNHKFNDYDVHKLVKQLPPLS